jgi:hypothetical protein
MVLVDLAEICRKVADHPAVPEAMREKARNFVKQYEFLLPVRGKGNADEHFWGETLLVQIAGFLPQILELRSWPPVKGLDGTSGLSPIVPGLSATPSKIVAEVTDFHSYGWVRDPCVTRNQSKILPTSG